MTKRNAVPIQYDGIGTRISDMADNLGSRKNAASVGNVSTDTLQRWIRQEVQPSFIALALMAEEASYNLNWIPSGEGAKKKGDLNEVKESSNGYTGAPTLTMDEVGDVMRKSWEKYEDAVKAANYRPNRAVEEHLKSLIFSASLKCSLELDALISLLAALKDNSTDD